MTPLRYRMAAVLSGLLISLRVWAVDPFVVKDIRVEGLKRISVGTVLNYLPLNVGDTLDDTRSAAIIRALFNAGFFDDVRLSAEDGTLVITVRERPTIASIAISGNKEIKTEQLTEALKSVGLAEGRVFDRSSLERMKLELERQYFTQGRYGVKVQATIKDLGDNRVDVKIEIEEGSIARILQIGIVGNNAFSERELLGKFELSPATMFSFFSDNDQYSRRKLSGDLESLRSQYLDNGYVNFSIDSTQVSITPDKRDVYITVNVTEGEQYTVSDVQLTGKLIVPEEELRKLIVIKPGEIFSRKLAQQSASAISERLGREGYAFANVSPQPRLDREKREVALVFTVDPGRRIYVRRIDVAGNLKTQDEVIRREVRQMEGGWISTDKVNLSRSRLNRLGYFEDANVETPAVAGVPDQVDIDFSVKERPSGTLMAGVGYSESQGFLVNASISQNNIFGTGKRVSAALNNSSVDRVYSFSYTNPYYTLDGISRGFNLYDRQTDAGEASIADYSSDAYGLSIDYGFPLSEFNTASLSIGYEHTTVHTSDNTPPSFIDFLDENAADRFDLYKLTAGLTNDTRNRAILADRGRMHSISAEVAAPGSGLEYFKARYRGLQYLPLFADLTLLFKAEVGYGDGYGKTSTLPFFENYYAGGSDSVRGYEGNSLGPRELDRPLGGGFKTVGNVELIFPVPFAEDNKSLRLSTFFDIGNVFADVGSFRTGELRTSVGISVIWYTPIAPMTFSLARPLNDQPGDDTEAFQFTLGSFFF
jgi:outer membrane protein insertion porin family